MTHSFLPKPSIRKPQSTPAGEQDGLSLTAVWRMCAIGTCRASQSDGVGKDLPQDLDLVRYWGGLNQVGFNVDRMPWGSGGKLMIACLNKSGLEGEKTGARLKL